MPACIQKAIVFFILIVIAPAISHAVPDGTGREIFNTGNVGIGTLTPQGALVVTNGNVGLGTFAPVAPLHVNGQMNMNTTKPALMPSNLAMKSYL